MEEDNNTMHRYRDSLVVRHNGSYERAARLCVIPLVR